LIFLIGSYHFAPIVYSVIDEDAPTQAVANIKYGRNIFKQEHKAYWRYFFANILFTVVFVIILNNIGSPVTTNTQTVTPPCSSFGSLDTLCPQPYTTTTKDISFNNTVVSDVVSTAWITVVLGAPYAFIYQQAKKKEESLVDSSAPTSNPTI